MSLRPPKSTRLDTPFPCTTSFRSAVETDADGGMVVFREEYYEMRKQPSEGTPEHVAGQEKMDRIQNLAEVIIGKPRHGPIGRIVLHFESAFTRFGDHVAADHLPAAF